MNAALSVVCPANVLSIFASSSSRIEIPTDVGAKAQPAAKPSKYRPVNAPTTTVPDASGSAVPAIATASARRPTTFIFSKWMCIPDGHDHRRHADNADERPDRLDVLPPFHVAPVQPPPDDRRPLGGGGALLLHSSAYRLGEALSGAHAPSLAYGDVEDLRRRRLDLDLQRAQGTFGADLGEAGELRLQPVMRAPDSSRPA